MFIHRCDPSPITRDSFFSFALPILQLSRSAAAGVQSNPLTTRYLHVENHCCKRSVFIQVNNGMVVVILTIGEPDEEIIKKYTGKSTSPSKTNTFSN